jgi:MFS family permease
MSTFGIARLVTNIPAGILMDRIGRKLPILSGMILVSIGALITAFARNIYFIILARLMQGIGSGLYSSTFVVLIGDIAPQGHRGKYMSYFLGTVFLGSTIGPTIGGLIADTWGLRVLFLIPFILSIFSITLAYIIIPETLTKAQRKKTSLSNFFTILKKMFSNKNIVIGFIISTSIFLVFGIRGTTIPLFAKETISLSTIEIGTMYSIGSISNIVTIQLAGRMGDKFGRRRIIFSGFLLLSISSFTFLYTKNFNQIIISYALFMVSFGLVNTSQQTFSIDIADPSQRGLYVGIYREGEALGGMIGPMIAGFLIDNFGFSYPFITIILISTLMSVMSIFIKESNTKQ